MRARKRFGQNFLSDQAIIQRIINAIGAAPGQHILEIGPGHGALTKHLIASGATLEVVEIDRDLVAELTATHGDALRIHSADVLAFDLATQPPGTRLVGNLPYNISTPLLFRTFEHVDRFRDMTFMLQAEVVDRMSAEPGTGDYGRLSIMCQYFCEVESLIDVPPSAFTPAPKVNSAIVRLTPRATREPTIEDASLMGDLLRAAFSKRRKTLRNALRGYVTDEGFEALGIDPAQRPENLDVTTWVQCANWTARAKAAGKT